MKTTRMTSFVFSCIGIAWLILTYAASLFVLQQMIYAIENPSTEINVVVAIFLTIFAAASLLIVFVFPILPALFTFIFALMAIGSSVKWIHVTAIVFTSLCGLSFLTSIIGLLMLIF